MNKNKTDCPEGQPYKVQRSSPRFPPGAFPSLKGACLLSGSEVKLINISKGGALFECGVRLRPSTRVCLRFITSEGIIQLHGQILRSAITHLNGGPQYRLAVAFEQEFPLQPENATTESPPEKEILPEPQPSPPKYANAHIQPQIVPDPAKGKDDDLVTSTPRILEVEPDPAKLFRITKW